MSWKLNCYRVVERPETWERAQQACAAQGGNLASIDMSYDQAFVSGVVLQGRGDAWIGLRRKVNPPSHSWGYTNHNDCYVYTSHASDSYRPNGTKITINGSAKGKMILEVMKIVIIYVYI